MSKVGIFGGTFDPVHFGHLITARAVLEIRDLDKIVFIPANISPHKTDSTSSAAEYRLKMLQLAIDGISYFTISDIELNREGVSYTIDTLKTLKEKYKEIELIIGEDNLQSFHTWKNPEEILKLSKLTVLKRKFDRSSAVNHDYIEKAEFVETPVIEISGSKIRERTKNDLSIDFLLPENVKKYILKNNLYKD